MCIENNPTVYKLLQLNSYFTNYRIVYYRPLAVAFLTSKLEQYLLPLLMPFCPLAQIQIADWRSQKVELQFQASHDSRIVQQYYLSKRSLQSVRGSTVQLVGLVRCVALPWNQSLRLILSLHSWSQSIDSFGSIFSRRLLQSSPVQYSTRVCSKSIFWKVLFSFFFGC